MNPVKRNIVTAAAIVVALASTAAFYLWETKYSYFLLDKKDKESALIKEVKADTFSHKEIKDMMHSKLKDPDSVLLKLSHVYKLKYDDKEMKDVETFFICGEFNAKGGFGYTGYAPLEIVYTEKVGTSVFIHGTTNFCEQAKEAVK